MNMYEQQYYQSFLNAPPHYAGLPVIEYNNPESHIPGEKEFKMTPVTMLTYVKIGEVFLPITHSEMLPNIMPGRYYVSNFGRVYDAYRQKYLPGTDNGHGYYNVKLTYIKDSQTLSYKTVYIHQLVNYYFNYNNVALRDKFSCNHIDSNKQNNRADNLEWISQAENQYHKLLREYKDYNDSLRTDTNLNRSTAHSNITLEAAKQICQLLSEGYSVGAISNMLGIKEHTIQDIKYRRNWAWLSKDYAFPSDNNVVYNINLGTEKLDIICTMLKSGKSLDEISSVTHIDKNIIASVKYNNNFKSTRERYGLQ